MGHTLREGLGCYGLVLGEEVCQRLELYLAEMLRWNRQVNLTAITDPAEATEKHLIDSLLLLPFVGDYKNLLDMGSGAGLPGIPLRIACPALKVVSVDSVGKKISFQRHIKRLLSLEGFNPQHVRLEGLTARLPEGTKFDLVTARAFSSLETIILLASPWLSVGGKILAMKGPEGEEEIVSAKEIISDAGLVVEAVHKCSLPFSGAERQVIVLTKE